MQDHQDLMNYFDCAGKSKQPPCKILRVWTKIEENLSKKWRFFDQNLYRKLTFFHNFLLIISGSAESAPKISEDLLNWNAL